MSREREAVSDDGKPGMELSVTVINCADRRVSHHRKVHGCGGGPTFISGELKYDIAICDGETEAFF